MIENHRYAYSTSSVKQIESSVIKDGSGSFLLMMKASAAAFNYLNSVLVSDRIVVFCGKGNNGGDGYGLAYLLKISGYEVRLIKLEEPKTENALKAKEFCESIGLIAESWQKQIVPGNIYIDAILGAGLNRKPLGIYKEAIDFLRNKKDEGCSVYSLDVPSGINGTSGQAKGLAVKASVTITFLVLKQGLLTDDAVDHVGELLLFDLGVPEKKSVRPDVFILNKEDCDLPIPDPSSHKGTRGSVVVIGGMEGMEGAGILAGLAALKVGAGKVFWVTNTRSLDRPLELITVDPSVVNVLRLINQVGICILGPGLGNEFDDLANEIWKSSIPIVLDADGLRWLAKKNITGLRANLIGTPHQGEALDFTGDRGLDRFQTLSLLANKFGGSWVLKGAGSLIYEEEKVWLNNFSTSQLATAGSGDVLAGIIGGLWSLGSSSPTRSGVWLHSNFGIEAIKRGRFPFITSSDLLKSS